ncbi:uncharacterized protein LOC125654737 [Ostrea edulis]|uniref:uncharacterized protein LOC125654737 n=1 Tax=Ostrea edulis TaxID=37623 RepID=UPI0024AFCD20|nr:uncharacterized protein LOC125654737 [Ostrea edulis]
MAGTINQGQFLITCGLCDNSTQQYCNSCQINLCVYCVSVHVEKLKTTKHDIVPYQDRDIKFTFRLCAKHSNQRCEAQCQQCDVQVCMKCIISNHIGHTIGEIPNIFNIQRLGIEKDTSELEKVLIPKYKQNEKDVDAKILKVTQEHEKMENEGGNLRRFWHQEVNRIFDTIRYNIRFSNYYQTSSLKAHQTRLRDEVIKMTKTLQNNKEFLLSNKVLDVTNYKSQINKYRDMPRESDVDIPALKTNVLLDQEIRVGFGDFEAALTQVRTSGLNTTFPHLPKKYLLNPVLLLANVATPVKPLFRIAITGTNEIWVSGIRDKTIRRYNIKGKEVDTVATSCPQQPDDISVTRNGDLIFTDCYNRDVKMVKNEKITTLFSTPWRWHPRGICCTKSGGFLVSVLHVDMKRRKILRYQENTLKQEIEKDEQGNPILVEGNLMVFLAESNNGDICCSDPNARVMLVMDRYGHVRFRYDGQASLREKPFDPAVIVTDSANHIIVADSNNECVHILDEDGKILLRLINIGSMPAALGLDTQGRLWVGLRDEGQVKVIQYSK